MDVKPNGNRWLAITSLIFGMIAFGLAIHPFRLVPERLSEDPDPLVIYRFGQTAPRFWIGSWIFGLPACIKAVIVLRRNKSEGSDKKTKNIATISLLLSGIVVVMVFVFITITPTPVRSYPQLIGPINPLP